MNADQTEIEIKPVPGPDDWPQNADGITDWEVLFETPETGLISLADNSETPEQLKLQTQAIIRTVFKRKRDQNIISKVMAFLEKLIPDDAECDADQFRTMRASVKQMLRKVKNDRIKRAIAFIANKKNKPNLRVQKKN